MATEQVPRTRCDRPGCNAVVTENGGRFYLDAADGLVPVELPKPDTITIAGFDLCRACAESLRTWWASKEARAATKAVGK